MIQSGMKRAHPYQPLLLRILHGLTGLFLISAILTAYWTYDIYDGRWVEIGLPDFQAIEGVHGTFGLWTLLIFPAFVLYSFHRGQQRLVQPNSFSKLIRIGKPVWWYTLNRFTNTLALIALTFALFSGKMMDETWLPKGELNHFWYSAHLISWIVMVGAIALHLLMNAKVGGIPLLLSMLSLKSHHKDSPQYWPNHLSSWNIYIQKSTSYDWLIFFMGMATLEKIIFASLLLAWILSFFK